MADPTAVVVVPAQTLDDRLRALGDADLDALRSRHPLHEVFDNGFGNGFDNGFSNNWDSTPLTNTPDEAGARSDRS
jgi:hypothetical protein